MHNNTDNKSSSNQQDHNQTNDNSNNEQETIKTKETNSEQQPDTNVQTTTTEQNKTGSSSSSHQSTNSSVKYHTVDPVVDDVPEEKKVEYRKFAWKYIQQLGNSLKITKVTVLATALVYYHRFYAQYSYKEFDNSLVATTCLFLSAKVEEKFRKLDNFISHAYHIRTKEKITPEDPVFKDYRQKVIQMEGILVQTLDFNFEVDHPHRYIADLLKNVKDYLTVDLNPSQGKEFVRIAGNFVNDSLRTPLCISYSSRQIACAALSLALKCHKYQFKEGFSWEKVDVKDEDVTTISNKILDIYEKNQSPNSSNQQSSSGSTGPKLPFAKPQNSKSKTSSSQKDIALPFKTSQSKKQNDKNNNNNNSEKQNNNSTDDNDDNKTQNQKNE